MRVDGNLQDCGTTAALAARVAGKRLLLHAAMNARFFEGLESRGLGVRQPRLDASLGESPATAASLDQQEFNASPSNAVAHGSYLFTIPQLAKLRWLEESV